MLLPLYKSSMACLNQEAVENTFREPKGISWKTLNAQQPILQKSRNWWKKGMWPNWIQTKNHRAKRGGSYNIIWSASMTKINRSSTAHSSSPGPVLGPSLLEVLIRFREYSVAVGCEGNIPSSLISEGFGTRSGCLWMAGAPWSFYVDNCLQSLNTADGARKLIDHLR